MAVLKSLYNHALIILSKSTRIFGREVDGVDKRWMDVEVIIGRWQAQMKGHRIKGKSKLIQRGFVGCTRSSMYIELYYLDVSTNAFRGRGAEKHKDSRD